jgi:hypothetical protein
MDPFVGLQEIIPREKRRAHGDAVRSLCLKTGTEPRLIPFKKKPPHFLTEKQKIRHCLPSVRAIEFGA